MRARKKLKPGQAGTKNLVAQYGEQLVCVRYRYDAERRERYKTVELIVETTPWQPPPPKVPADWIVGLRITLQEVELQRQARRAGGIWNGAQKWWELRYDKTVALGLEARIDPSTLPNSRQPQMATIRPPEVSIIRRK